MSTPSHSSAGRRRRAAGSGGGGGTARRGAEASSAQKGKIPSRVDGLHTVRETSAGGIVLQGLSADAIPGRGDATGMERLLVALIGRTDRRGRLLWSLPKGHIEAGESTEQTAVREIREETGISGSVLAPLGSIDYWFVASGRRIHKTVHHFLLRYIAGELSDEDIEVTEVAWVPLGELPSRLAYADERRLAREARTVLAALGHRVMPGPS